MFQETNHKDSDPSFVVALEIAKQKKAQTFGETLIKPCALKMVESFLGNGLMSKLAADSLSNTTVRRRISK